MKSILSKDFRYTPAAQTDIRKTIRRAQREIDEQKKRDAENAQEAARVVAPINRRAK